MLTIRKIRVASGDARAARRAAEYVLNQRDTPESVTRAREERDGRPHGSTRWTGSPMMLARLGVHRDAAVGRDELARALQGRSVQTGDRIRTEGMIHREDVDEEGRRTIVRVRGTKSVDLTFSAPKSVSVVWSQGAPALRREIEDAMLRAADIMVDTMVTTRPVVALQRTLVPARGCAAAAALHVMARASAADPVPAPQLHVHSIVVGVERSDGFYASPELSGMFKAGAPLEGGAMARLVLAERLVDLGFAIESDGRSFAIRGVPPGLVDRLSARTRDVQKEVRRRELLRGRPLESRERAAIALQTRRPKSAEVGVAQAVASWAAHAEEFGIDAASVEALRTGLGFVGTAQERAAAIADADSTRFLERAAGRLRLSEARAMLRAQADGAPRTR